MTRPRFPRLRALVGRCLRFGADRIDREHSVAPLGAYFNIVPGKGLVFTETDDGLRDDEDRGVPLMFPVDKYDSHVWRERDGFDGLAPLERGEWRAWRFGRELNAEDAAYNDGVESQRLREKAQGVVMPGYCPGAYAAAVSAYEDGYDVVRSYCQVNDHEHGTFVRFTMGGTLVPPPPDVVHGDPTALTPYTLARLRSIGVLTVEAFTALAAAWDYPTAGQTDGYDSLVVEPAGTFGATIGRALDEGVIDAETYDAVLAALGGRA